MKSFLIFLSLISLTAGGVVDVAASAAISGSTVSKNDSFVNIEKAKEAMANSKNSNSL